MVGVPNFAYVKIKNRGFQTATNVVVKGFHCVPSSGLTWPNDWQAMTTAQLSTSNVAPNNSAEFIVGPFQWTPSQVGHECMLMIVSATGDTSNIDLLSTGESIPHCRLVPHDNNIGQRNVSPVPAGGGLRGLLTSFSPRRFLVRNPNPRRARMEIKPTLPQLLQERDWSFTFENPGGSAFTLDPGQTREMVFRLNPGGEFSKEEAKEEKEPTIHMNTYADGILVGGVSYELDPDLTEAPRELPKSGHCKARELLDCLNLSGCTKKARISKIIVEIDLDDEDDC